MISHLFFLISDGVIDEINSMVAKFSWGSRNGDTKMD